MHHFKEDEEQLNIMLHKLEKKCDGGGLNDNKNNLASLATKNINAAQEKSSSLLEVEDYINLTCEIHKIRKEIKSWERKIQLLTLN